MKKERSFPLLVILIGVISSVFAIDRDDDRYTFKPRNYHNNKRGFQRRRGAKVREPSSGMEHLTPFNATELLLNLYDNDDDDEGEIDDEEYDYTILSNDGNDDFFYSAPYARLPRRRRRLRTRNMYNRRKMRPGRMNYYSVSINVICLG